MDFEKLLLGRDDCPCGLKHSCALKRIRLYSGVLNEVGALSEGWDHVLLVADRNTWALCGEKIAAQLGGKAYRFIFPDEGLLVPNEDAIARLETAVRPETDLIIGIGSGVINDLCKYVSYKKGLDYFIVATAPSMDGYASVHAAMIIDGGKVTYPAHMVHTVIADTDVLASAPEDMLRSGYGDILGKFSALNDWKLSCLMYDEYFCQYVYDLIYDCTVRTAPIGPALMRREKAAVETLMEAILITGIAMAYIGNSRPASGSEHHLSHFFEVNGLLTHTPYFLHGMDVAYATVESQKMREELLSLPAPAPAAPFPDWQEELRKVYGTVAEPLIALQVRQGRYAEALAAEAAAKWEAIRSLLREVPDSKALTAYLASVGLPMERYEAEYSVSVRSKARLWAKDLKDRFTVLWLWFVLIGKADPDA